MNRVKEVLRCYAAGYGTKSISNMLGIARNTVKKYLRKAEQLPQTIGELVALDDSRLNELITGEPRKETVSERKLELESLLPEYCRRLKKKRVTKKKLFEEYQRDHPDGYGRTRFNNLLATYMAVNRPIAHLEHKAGDKMYVDFAGDKLSIVDTETGELSPVDVFVSILPCSQLTYVEAVASQKKEDFIRCCQNALLFYGGAPAVIVPDNLKAAVKRPSRYEAELNEDFAAFAEHYGCVVIPARVRKPRDKALVESAVRLVYKNIYPSVEDMHHTSLTALNAAIRTALEFHNNAPMNGGHRQSRRAQYEEIEREFMRPLPATLFELRQRKQCTVQKNGYIYLERHYYSVPYIHIGKKVSVMYDSNTVDIYSGYEKVASHTRSYREYGYTTVPEHLASNCRIATEWSTEAFIRQAREIDESVADYICSVIEKKQHPEQAYKSCSGILSFAKRVGRQRLINACRLAASFGMFNYMAINDIIRNGQDTLPPEDTDDAQNARLPKHGNIRGKHYFK